MHRVFRFLIGTMNHSLRFNGQVWKAYCDANRIFDNNELDSTKGCAFILDGGVVSYKFEYIYIKAHYRVQFIAMDMTSSGVDWLRSFRLDILLWVKPSSSIAL